MFQQSFHLLSTSPFWPKKHTTKIRINEQITHSFNKIWKRKTNIQPPNEWETEYIQHAHHFKYDLFLVQTRKGNQSVKSQLWWQPTSFTFRSNPVYFPHSKGHTEGIPCRQKWWHSMWWVLASTSMPISPYFPTRPSLAFNAFFSLFKFTLICKLYT